MRFLADLHIHSRFSRATSRDLDVPGLLTWACRKGISVVGTGDVTHPGWLAHLREHLEEAGDGTLIPRPNVAAEALSSLPAVLHRAVRFVFTGEVSSIFSSGGRVRKVHTLVLLPDLRAVERFDAALAALGNVTSDGRPILGVPPRRILELAMDADPGAYVIPAHVWTPHFGLFGARSGFDTIEDCFGDLAEKVFALETGLSSDIAMNRRWSALDRFAMVSFSDAHSPSKLGREATIFEGDATFAGMREAMRQNRLAGTIEFFPEEGKYHLDGHRNCGFSAEPQVSRALEGRCPRCGGVLTPGVLGRVDALADRDRADPSFYLGQQRLVPLVEVLSEVLGVGPASRKVAAAYERVLSAHGPELPLMAWESLQPLRQSGETRLAKALERIRAGHVTLTSGFDGEYGRVRALDKGDQT